ncbi:hypothetical protein D3P09_24825 [Paenibacillus pinisoli]|uniref:DUF4034 domain-containing protein n=1 Tax=Paenibacillus pinisoli TaxID=1276110 RepID=A0A3A6PM33_9BACL|nr:hypothetical protein [Paenibacillus pinisoli]RJX37133.1 hypothetical protein D3P09_24825 [Paenibacillus pinisoli]
MRNRFNELRRGSWSITDEKQKVATFEEMIVMADRYMTEEDAYDTRINYMSAALDAGSREKILVAFSWCLAKFEQTPGEYSVHTLLWYYKWVLNEIWRMPEFSLDQVERIYEDFKQKCIQHGYNLRPYYQQKVNFLLSQGMLAEATEFYKLWRATPRDSLADCKACEQNLFGVYQFKMNHYKRGMGTLKPILEGKMSCHAVPQNTYSHTIVPLLKLKEYDQAIAIAKKARRLIKGPQFLEEHGIFLEFFTVTDLPKAVKIYNDTIRYGLDSKVGWDRFHYFLSVRMFLAEWHKKSRRKKLAEADRVTMDWLDWEIARLAEAFDRRNGNSYMTGFIEEKSLHTRRLIAAFASRS